MYPPWYVFGMKLSKRALPFRSWSFSTRKAAGHSLPHRRGVADDNGTVVGLYILHPNNVGRCGHIANASYAVDSACRGKHIGEQLVSDCLVQARNNGFKLMQFNAVVENNTHARHLYERLGFVQVGMIPNGFLITRGVIPLPLGMGI